MRATNGECFVRSEDALRALEAAGVTKSAATGQAKNRNIGQDEMIDFYIRKWNPGQTQPLNPDQIRTVVMREFLLLMEENHVTAEILDAVCKYIESEPATAQRLIAYLKYTKNM